MSKVLRFLAAVLLGSFVGVNLSMGLSVVEIVAEAAIRFLLKCLLGFYAVRPHNFLLDTLHFYGILVLPSLGSCVLALVILRDWITGNRTSVRSILNLPSRTVRWFIVPVFGIVVCGFLELLVWISICLCGAFDLRNPLSDRMMFMVVYVLPLAVGQALAFLRLRKWIFETPQTGSGAKS